MLNNKTLTHVTLYSATCMNINDSTEKKLMKPEPT